MSLSNVEVHYNSAQPAQLDALAYARGSEIHVAPGQEQHLTHEAWHVVQQAQGRVKPSMRLTGGASVNDNSSLEREADVMGTKATARSVFAGGKSPSLKSFPVPATTTPRAAACVQRKRGSAKQKAKKERDRRLKALDRLNRGSPATFDHLDPEIARNLQELDAAQPRRSAARRTLAARPQLLREANLPSIWR